MKDSIAPLISPADDKILNEKNIKAILENPKCINDPTYGLSLVQHIIETRHDQFTSANVNTYEAIDGKITTKETTTNKEKQLFTLSRFVKANLSCISHKITINEIIIEPEKELAKIEYQENIIIAYDTKTGRRQSDVQNTCRAIISKGETTPLIFQQKCSGTAKEKAIKKPDTKTEL